MVVRKFSTSRLFLVVVVAFTDPSIITYKTLGYLKLFIESYRTQCTVFFKIVIISLYYKQSKLKLSLKIFIRYRAILKLNIKLT